VTGAAGGIGKARGDTGGPSGAGDHTGGSAETAPGSNTGGMSAVGGNTGGRSGRGAPALARAVESEGARVIVANVSQIRGLDLPSVRTVSL